MFSNNCWCSYFVTGQRSVGNQWGILLYLHFFSTYHLVFYKRKESHAGLEQHEADKMMTECSFLGELFK